MTELLDQSGLVGRLSLFRRLQDQKRVGLIGSHRVEAELVRSGSSHDTCDVRYLRKNGGLKPRIDRNRLVEIDGRNRLDADDDVAFVHGRHECLAELGVGKARRNQGGHRCDHHLALIVQCPAKRRRIAA